MGAHAGPQADRRDVPRSAILTSFLLGGIFALLVRTELLTPRADDSSSTPTTYNQLFTLHGAIMVFLVIIPGIPAALGNFVAADHARRQGRGVPAS